MLTQGNGQSPNLGVAHRLLAAGITWCPSPGQARQDGVRERVAGELVVGVFTAEQQRAQPIGLAELEWPSSGSGKRLQRRHHRP